MKESDSSGVEPLRLPRITRRRLLWAAGGGAAAVAGTGIYAWRIEPHWVEFVYRDLRVQRLPDALVGRRLVQLSDLHIGPDVSADYLQSVFRQVALLEPDIIVYSGDFLSQNAEPEIHGQAIMSKLPRGSMATLGVLGNHDYGPNWSHPEFADSIVRLAEDRGVSILRNQVADVSGLHILGLDDLWSGRFDLHTAMQSMDAGSAAIVLSHNPDSVDRAGWDRYEGWILSGHTHGGQVRPPFLRPPLIPVKNQRYVAGVVELSGKRKLYINRGVGHLMRLRFNVRPEVTVFRLQSESVV